MTAHHAFRYLFLSLGFLLGTVALAADTDKKPKEDHATKEPPMIADVLDEFTECEFAEAPLSDVVEFLRTRHAIPILIDNRALQQDGIPTDAAVTCNLKNISLRAALSWVLRDHGLDWTVHDEVVLVTTRDIAATTLSTLVYDVSDIVPAPIKDDKAKSDEALKTLERLVDAVRSSAEPDSWSDRGGPGTVAAFEVGPARMLIVYQNRRGHEAVMLLLDDIAFCAEDARLDHDKRSSGAHAKVTHWTAPQPSTAPGIVETAHRSSRPVPGQRHLGHPLGR